MNIKSITQSTHHQNFSISEGIVSEDIIRIEVGCLLVIVTLRFRSKPHNYINLRSTLVQQLVSLVEERVSAEKYLIEETIETYIRKHFNINHILYKVNHDMYVRASVVRNSDTVLLW